MAAASAWGGQGLALRRRSLYDRLRAIAEDHQTCRPSAVLVAQPLGAAADRQFCLNADLRDCYVGVECRETLEEWERPVWITSNWVVGSTYHTLDQVVSQTAPGGRFPWETPKFKRAARPAPERMAYAAPAFGISPSEKRALDLIPDHRMIPGNTWPAGWASPTSGSARRCTPSLTPGN